MNDAVEKVILVDEHDNDIGLAGKLDVHRSGELHRAFSVFGFNRAGELLLQKRAMSKYHSPGLWANTCCGHPRPQEPTKPAATRRTYEELGVRPCLVSGFRTLYRADVGNDLIEHELVHVYGCMIDDLPKPDPAEASEVRFADIDQIATEIRSHPVRYAAWLRYYFEQHLEEIKAIPKGSLAAL